MNISYLQEIYDRANNALGKIFLRIIIFLKIKTVQLEKFISILPTLHKIYALRI